jgi:hypothetical protein
MMPYHAHVGSVVIHYLARISPILGGAIILSALLLDSGADASWKFIVPIVFGVFVTLVGMLYHQHETRITSLEEETLPRREFDIAHQSVQAEQGRMEKHLEAIDNRDIWKKKSGQ